MPHSTVLVLAPRIKINGQELSAQHYDDIIDLRVSQSVSMPSQLSLRMSDRDFTLVDGNVFAIAGEIEVSFPGAQAMVTVFSGEIVSIGSDQRADRPDAAELVVTAFDKGHRLSRTTRVRTFQKQSYADVVRSIAGEEGLTASIDPLTVKFDYLIQTTTNFALLDEIAFRTGCEWSVKGRELRFRKRKITAPVTVEYGLDLRRLKARFSSSNEFTNVSVRSWDPLTKRVVVGTATPAKTRADGQNHGATGLATKGRSDAKSYAGTFDASSLVATSQAEAAELAEALGSRLASADLSARADCLGRPEITAGGTVEIKGAGTRLSGTYYVTTVEHTFGRDADMATTFTTGGVEQTSIVDMLGGGNEPVEGFGRTGLTIGIVTNNKDPDGMGRVRVKFPALSDQEESWWARVVTPGGGQQSGLMLMPQIDDEVLVGFEHGDLRRPYVLGGLWGPKAKPPTSAEQFLAQNKVIEWGLRTAAGATLAFRGGDQPKDKHFKVALADGTTHYLGSDKVEIIAQRKSIELKSGQASILITDRGDIQLKGTNVTIDATTSLKLAGMTIDAKANTSFKAEGSATLELKGGGTSKLEATGITEVKGALVKIN